MRRRRVDNRGSVRSAFTLIELMLVVVIIAVLAAVVAPRLTNRSQEARISAAKAQIANFDTALELFEGDTGRYPTNEEGLRALVEQPANAPDWKGPYMKRGVPLDPWNHEYIYQAPGQHNPSSYDLSSLGPNGAPGVDDVDNWSQR